MYLSVEKQLPCMQCNFNKNVLEMADVVAWTLLGAK